LNGRLTFVPARADVPEIMAALDILVQPSLTEAGPRAPLEAMAMARPVVGTRVGGTAEEIVDGETGVLVPSAQAEPLARAIATLLDSPVERRRLGRAGRARVERYYSLASTADLIERVYQDAAQAHAGVR
jgi:glycosyltransferase involved in cell wall biosynthesis